MIAVEPVSSLPPREKERPEPRRLPVPISQVPDPIERASRRVSHLQAFLVAGATLVGAGFAAATALYAWQVVELKAEIEKLRTEQRRFELDLRSEALSRNGLAERVSSVEGAFNIMPTDDVLRVSATNKKKRLEKLEGNTTASK